MGHIRAKSNVTAPAVVRTPRGYRIMAIVFALWLCFRSLSQYDWSVPHWKPPKGDSEWPEEPVVKNRRMALVIPINIPSPNVCKTILSATVLGYPAPIILNWKENHQDISHWELGRCLPKIPGMVHYLDTVMHPNATDLEKLEEDDLVLMVDGRDVWFQLPVEVVISRYHEINRRANERLRKQWKGKGPMPMKQTIVAASERNCYPNDPELFGVDLRCDIWPESPLRPDLYGPETDKNISNFQHTRPRWINGGMYIGPAGDMRRFFRRAMEKMDAYIGEAFPLRSEQGMFGYLMGQQEVWRQHQRENHMKDLDLKDLVEENLEWHAGLDYGMEIANQVAYSDIDKSLNLYHADFALLGDKERTQRQSEARGISPTRLNGVPEDIMASRNPLTKFEKSANWSNMPLYADFAIGTVPAIIHHNGYKERRQTWWDQPWYHQKLRKLYPSKVKFRPFDESLATVETEDGLVRYWAPLAEARDRYPRKVNETANARFPKMEFEELCHWEEKPLKDARTNWWDEVMRDGGVKFS
ncbi:uncharacterized protein B0J16DRAFT_304238 [Fusarium flagelliforme]|uniref:uncharacterized protein n=1 Tax=Fusarium flagelliforme TaxID=2675880 RepID=UPI001E8D7BF4|nr:uncharacterized protein B0J16DRAFT_304238 [Fusarium flagelliforme]KAH7184983.1 hypothetical protein B0J16DRAFT_304238 [Fusarium flagelliforme]